MAKVAASTAKAAAGPARATSAAPISGPTRLPTWSAPVSAALAR